MTHSQNWTHRMLTRFFGAPEEINGAGICPTYLYRWVLGSLLGRKVYIHHFVGNDWSLDYHDHPKDFLSIGLWGSYEEHTPAADGGAVRDALNGWLDALTEQAISHGMNPTVKLGEHFQKTEVTEIQTFYAPWVRAFPAHWKHRIETPSGSCWTLVIVGPIKREWGFWHAGKFVGWKEYVYSSKFAEVRANRKGCD